MTKREYKTVRLELRAGFLERADPDLDATLNEYGEPLGETSRYVLIFEREA